MTNGRPSEKFSDFRTIQGGKFNTSISLGINLSNSIYNNFNTEQSINVIPAVKALATKAEGDYKTGVNIVLRALEEPVRQIAINAGVDGSVVVENVKRSKKAGYGYDAKLDEYGVMTDRGIIDPTKVTRSALQNAASIAAMVLTTESLVCDIPAPEPAAPAPGAGGMGGMY